MPIEELPQGQFYINDTPIGEIQEISLKEWDTVETITPLNYNPIELNYNIKPTTFSTCIPIMEGRHFFYKFYGMKLPRKKKKIFIGTKSSRRRKRNESFSRKIHN